VIVVLIVVAIVVEKGRDNDWDNDCCNDGADMQLRLRAGLDESRAWCRALARHLQQKAARLCIVLRC
jgi:hypothetical protein